MTPALLYFPTLTFWRTNFFYKVDYSFCFCVYFLFINLFLLRPSVFARAVAGGHKSACAATITIHDFVLSLSIRITAHGMACVVGHVVALPFSHALLCCEDGSRQMSQRWWNRRTRLFPPFFFSLCRVFVFIWEGVWPISSVPRVGWKSVFLLVIFFGNKEVEDQQPLPNSHKEIYNHVRRWCIWGMVFENGTKKM